MQAIKELLPEVLARLQTPQATVRSMLVSEWPAIAGPRFCSQTRPALTEKRELVIWVKQSTLAFELNQRYRGSFLKRAQAVLGEEKVTSVRVRVG